MEEADSCCRAGPTTCGWTFRYLHQALVKSGLEAEAALIQSDPGLLVRLPGWMLAFNDGTPFADEVTLNWIQQQVTDDSAGRGITQPQPVTILQLEPEALALADSQGTEAALAWLQNRPGMTTSRERWILRLLMARIAEQTGKNELALHLLAELDIHSTTLTLASGSRNCCLR
jgi:type VI secretion system protein VasJ